jgi:hypothetical protein
MPPAGRRHGLPSARRRHLPAQDEALDEARVCVMDRTDVYRPLPADPRIVTWTTEFLGVRRVPRQPFT